MGRNARATVGAAAAAGLLLLAGCDGGGEDPPATDGATESPTGEETTAEETTSPAQTPSAADDEGPDADAPPFPADTSPDTAEPSGEPDLLLTDVRAAEHDGFDRVVLEFLGTGTPGWRAEYVDEAVEDGRGTPIDVEGDGTWEIFVSGTRYPDEGEEGYYDGPRQFEPDTDEVEDVFVAGVFEGLTHVVLGTDDSESPFRVFALTDPVRVVIDVQDDDD